MVDLILAAFVAAIFAGGFWCGRRLPSRAALAERFKRAFNSDTP